MEDRGVRDVIDLLTDKDIQAEMSNILKNQRNNTQLKKQTNRGL